MLSLVTLSKWLYSLFFHLRSTPNWSVIGLRAIIKVQKPLLLITIFKKTSTKYLALCLGLHKGDKNGLFSNIWFLSKEPYTMGTAPNLLGTLWHQPAWASCHHWYSPVRLRCDGTCRGPVAYRMSPGCPMGLGNYYMTQSNPCAVPLPWHPMWGALLHLTTQRGPNLSQHLQSTVLSGGYLRPSGSKEIHYFIG